MMHFDSLFNDTELCFTACFEAITLNTQCQKCVKRVCLRNVTCCNASTSRVKTIEKEKLTIMLA